MAKRNFSRPYKKQTGYPSYAIVSDGETEKWYFQLMKEAEGVRSYITYRCNLKGSLEKVYSQVVDILKDEYIKSMDELKTFVDTCSIAEFEDYCEYAPQTMIDNIALIYTTTELIDTRKIRIYKEYTGKDLAEFYEDSAKEGLTVGTEEQQSEKKPARRKKIVKE